LLRMQLLGSPLHVRRHHSQAAGWFFLIWTAVLLYSTTANHVAHECKAETHVQWSLGSQAHAYALSLCATSCLSDVFCHSLPCPADKIRQEIANETELRFHVPMHALKSLLSAVSCSFPPLLLQTRSGRRLRMRPSGCCAQYLARRQCPQCPSTSQCTAQWCPTSHWWTCQVRQRLHGLCGAWAMGARLQACG
jgi:hypothetical protein